QVDQAMPRDLVEHVVEETDAGSQARLPRAVQIDAHGDLRLLRVAGDFGGAFGAHRDACRAASMRVFSSGVPTVTRRQLASNGCILETFLTSTPRAFRPSNVLLASGTRTR